jgi:hypothetical protein
MISKKVDEFLGAMTIKLGTERLFATLSRDRDFFHKHPGGFDKVLIVFAERIAPVVALEESNSRRAESKYSGDLSIYQLRIDRMIEDPGDTGLYELRCKSTETRMQSRHHRHPTRGSAQRDKQVLTLFHGVVKKQRIGMFLQQVLYLTRLAGI